MPSLPSTALALAASATAALAQTGGPEDYGFNYHNMGTDSAVFVSGPVLFGALTGNQSFAGPGDSIRTCYGIDSFQGGRNQSTGFANITHLSWVQSASLFSPNGVQPGLSSVLAQSVDSLDGDACLSSFFDQGVDTVTGAPITLNSSFGGALLLPSFQIPLGSTGLEIAAEFAGSNGIGIELPFTLGADGNGLPLIPHVVFEVQGPQNEGPNNNQYYLASTSEKIGLGSAGSGTGGVTNGNGRMGQAIFGITADLSGAVSHNRITGFSPATGLVGGTTVSFSSPASDHWSGYALATQTPMTWAVNGTSSGGGGPDWRVSATPITSLDLRVLDVRAGGEGDTLFSQTTGAVPFGTLIDNPGLIFNAPAFLWSTQSATLMLQQPLSWDTSTGSAIPGSPSFGFLATTRAGLQRLPIHSDPLTAGFLAIAKLSFGTSFRSAADPDADFFGPPGTYLEFGQGLDIDGESRLPQSLPAVAGPKPNLAGERLGIAAVGLQFDVATLQLTATEVASPVTVVLQ